MSWIYVAKLDRFLCNPINFLWGCTKNGILTLRVISLHWKYHKLDSRAVGTWKTGRGVGRGCPLLHISSISFKLSLAPHQIFIPTDGNANKNSIGNAKIGNSFKKTFHVVGTIFSDVILGWKFVMICRYLNKLPIGSKQVFSQFFS